MNHAIDLLRAGKEVPEGPKTNCQVAHIFPVSMGLAGSKAGGLVSSKFQGFCSSDDRS
jgi:hypothetical protein